MALDIATVTQALKEHYKPLRVANMVYKDNPMLALMPKYTQFGGENMPIPLIYGNPQRRSADFSNGKGVSSTSSLGRFVLTRVKDYSFASITGESIKATERDSDAFLRYATMEIDGAMHSLTRSLAISMYRDGTGSIGTIGSVDGQVFTLSNIEDVTNFEVGMVLNCFDNLTETTTDSRFDKPDSGDQESGDVTVTAVNRSTGEVTVSGTVTDMTAGDIFVQKGDINAKISGFEAWIPRVLDANNKTFFSQDRSADASRLAGQRFDGSALPIEEALIEGASLVSREGGAPDYCFVDFKTFSTIEKALSSKVVYGEVKARDVDMGFASIALRGPRGIINIVPDQNCQPNLAWMVQLDTWSLNTLGEAPMFLDFDNNQMLRENSADAYEVRMGYYGNLACNAPGYNCRVALA
tara:strand:+ start:3156 stop:4385 length:1230 start_codon:yes stop_codon:yes gene_type:complete